MTRGLFLAWLFLAALFASRSAHAETPRASFALIVGANDSVDPELLHLQYADDDAARYFDLFRLLGMRTILLARIDEPTRKLHSQAAAEALPPRRDAFTQATRTLAAEVAQAKRRGLSTAVYFVFAGHGGVKDARGYVSLEDARLTGDTLSEELVSRVDANAYHFILDACNSYLVAYSRGPGGERQPVTGFVDGVHELGRDPRVGLLLSTSSATESHEWDAFEAGVFSHEVRSGLYGAADADGDGRVDYREIAAFVARANQAIENHRHRPTIFARGPANGDDLLDLRAARTRGLRIDGSHAGRYFLEDSRGVRLVDFHNHRGQEVVLVRPPPTGNAYLRRPGDNVEFVLPPGDQLVELAQLAARAPHTAERGALHESFSRLFSLPFDRAAVLDYPDPAARRDVAPPAPAAGPSVRTVAGTGLVVAGVLGLGAGTYFAVQAKNADPPGPTASGAQVADHNATVAAQNRTAVWSYVAGGVAGAAGLTLLLWPQAKANVRATALPGGASVAYETRF